MLSGGSGGSRFVIIVKEATTSVAVTAAKKVAGVAVAMESKAKKMFKEEATVAKEAVEATTVKKVVEEAEVAKMAKEALVVKKAARRLRR
jgi:hypothetical protein